MTPASTAATAARTVSALLLCVVAWHAGKAVLLGAYQPSYSADEWMTVLHPTRHEIGHFGDIHPSQSLGSLY